MNFISDYFKLTARQAEQFAQLDALYRDWNSKINVISRKDIDNLYDHHVLHSLAIAKWIPFQPDTTILDVGTGGREGKIRLRRISRRHAPTRPGEVSAQEHLQQAPQCYPEWAHRPQRRGSASGSSALYKNCRDCSLQ